MKAHGVRLGRPVDLPDDARRRISAKMPTEMGGVSPAGNSRRFGEIVGWGQCCVAPTNAN